MKYEWDLNYIIQRKKELDNKLQESNLKIETDYDTYSLLLELYLSNKIETDFIELDEDEPYFDYSSIPVNIINNTLLVHNNSKKISVPYDENNLSKINLTNDELFEIVKNMYSQIPNKKIKTLFEKFTNNNLIYITSSKYNNGIYGLTLNDIEKSIPYSIIYRNNNIIDIIALNHEIAHMIFRYKENENFTNTNRFYLSEIEGCLFDMICYDNLIGLGFQYEEINNLIIKRINMIKVYSSEVFNSINKNNKYFTLEEIKEDCKDVFSNMCALDLYELYKNDKEQAIYNLSNLVHENNPNINKNLSNNNITFFEDNCQNLSKLMVKTRKKI